MLFPGPKTEQKRVPRFDLASKGKHAPDLEGLLRVDCETQPIVLSFKHPKQVDTSKESIRYPCQDNGSAARVSGRMNANSRSSRKDGGSCSSSAEGYDHFNNVYLKQEIEESPGGKQDLDGYHNYSRPQINPSALSVIRRHQNQSVTSRKKSIMSGRYEQYFDDDGDGDDGHQNESKFLYGAPF